MDSQGIKVQLNQLVKESYYHNKTGMLLYGDCLEWMDKIPDKSIDMVLADLPYGTTQNDWDVIIPFVPLWEQYNRIIKDHSAIVLTASQPFTSMLVMSNLKMFKCEWIWDKGRGSGSLNSKRRPMKFHENILVFSKHGTFYNPQMTKGKMQSKASGGNTTNYDSAKIVRYTNDDYYPRSIQSFLACHNMTGKVHPTQKPVALFEYLIKTYTNEGMIILDNTAGSCTTAVAAMNTNRKWICIEKELDYCKKSVERIQKECAG